jgi:hypothetical protein
MRGNATQQLTTLRRYIALVGLPARAFGILVPKPYLAACKAARAFCTTRAGISATALRRVRRLWAGPS